MNTSNNCACRIETVREEAIAPMKDQPSTPTRKVLERIVYCAEHGAAPQMREALQGIEKLVSQTLKGREAFRAIRREIKRMSHQTLTAAQEGSP